MPALPPRRLLAACGGLTAVALTALALAAPATAVHPAATATAHPGPLTARTILTGAGHGWSSPDDLTQLGQHLFVAFQNGVPATGGSAGTPTQSTIVEFLADGTVEHTWQVTGKCDGLAADAAAQRLVATVNEDGNSSLYTVPVSGGAPRHYSYDANPLPHGGGTDSVTIHQGQLYVVASNPANGGPALYRVSLGDGVAHLAGVPFSDTSAATVANSPGGGSTVNLALSDPDSSTVVPAQAPRFAGQFMLDAQGDQQAVFADHLGAAGQALRVLNLSQSVDDTAFPTATGGALLATDSHANSVVLLTGTFTPGDALTAVTPGNANTAPANPGPNYLGRINLQDGTVSPVPTAGVPFVPHGLIYLGSGYGAA